MDGALRSLVRERAKNRCEYCGLHQDHDPLFRFHVEHIVPRQHGGPDDAENLALACYFCNLHKGPNLTGIDPATGLVTPLFHPRQQPWVAHFRMEEGVVVGVTPTGRTTVRLLGMNNVVRRQLRVRVREIPNP